MDYCIRSTHTRYIIAKQYRKTLVETQKWYKKQYKRKNSIISIEISFIEAVIEFLKNMNCVSHLGRLNKESVSFYSSSFWHYTCIEDTKSLKILKFVHKIKKNCFYNFDDWNEFTRLHSRRF